MKTRSHAYPEYADYHDTGCSIAPRCLECPLARCRYDVSVNERGLETRQRVAALAGMPTEYVARELGVSTRTVWRALERLRA
jgi:hypothetical protein